MRRRISLASCHTTSAFSPAAVGSERNSSLDQLAIISLDPIPPLYLTCLILVREARISHPGVASKLCNVAGECCCARRAAISGMALRAETSHQEQKKRAATEAPSVSPPPREGLNSSCQLIREYITKFSKQNYPLIASEASRLSHFPAASYGRVGARLSPYTQRMSVKKRSRTASTQATNCQSMIPLTPSSMQTAATAAANASAVQNSLRLFPQIASP